jgi:hypothetical protein
MSDDSTYEEVMSEIASRIEAMDLAENFGADFELPPAGPLIVTPYEMFVMQRCCTEEGWETLSPALRGHLKAVMSKWYTRMPAPFPGAAPSTFGSLPVVVED